MLNSDSLVLYIHGKGGSPQECEHYRPLFAGCRVVGLDYKAETPWQARAEFPTALDALAGKNRPVLLVANSIGAFFAMHALPQQRLQQAFFISPVVDMQRLITDMMAWAGVSEADLQEQETIHTNFGETLSWEYLCYVRKHPLRWQVPTSILYGGQDNLTPRAVMEQFAVAHGAPLTVMEDGEHWFHTPRQMAFLDSWLARELKATDLYRNRGDAK